MLTQVSFALLYFYGWHAPKGGQLLFRFLLLSGFLPYPFATYHFFLPLFLSLLFSRIIRPSFFPRRSRCHGNCLIFHPFLAALFSLRFVLNFSRPPLFTSLISHIFSTFMFFRILSTSGFFPKNSGAPFSFRHLSGFFFLLISFLFFNTSFAILLLATL